MPDGRFSTRKGLLSGERAMSSAALETSMPTEMKSFMKRTLPCKCGLEGAACPSRCERLFGFGSRSGSRSRWASECFAPRASRSAACWLSGSLTSAPGPDCIKLVLCGWSSDWQVSASGRSRVWAGGRPAALRLAGARLRCAGRPPASTSWSFPEGTGTSNTGTFGSYKGAARALGQALETERPTHPETALPANIHRSPKKASSRMFSLLRRIFARRASEGWTGCQTRHSLACRASESSGFRISAPSG
jgi:hypothetical protein